MIPQVGVTQSNMKKILITFIQISFFVVMYFRPVKSLSGDFYFLPCILTDYQRNIPR